MLSLDATQLAIVAAGNKTEVSWLFQVDRNGNDTIDYHWSTKTKTWDGHDYVYKIAEFDDIEMNRAQSESGIQAPSSFDFTISNKDNTLVPSDFLGGNITLIQVVSAGGSEAEIRRWNFDIEGVEPGQQVLNVHCRDWLQKYIEGIYPNTPLIAHLFPEDDTEKDNFCVPLIFGKPCIPIAPIVFNSIPNGYMEVNGNWANWGSTPPTVNERSTEHVKEGDYSRKFTVQGASARSGIKSDAFTTENGKTYTIDFWVYPVNCNSINIAVRKGDDSGWNVYDKSWANEQTPVNMWSRVSVSFTEGAATGGAGAYIVFYGWAEPDTARTRYIDQAFLGTNRYLLGAKITNPTDYIVEELQTPRDWDGDHQIWSKNDYTFNYSHDTGADGNDYTFGEFLIADLNSDGTPDANMVFKKSKRYLPAAAWYTRSDTIALTSPGDVLDYILKDWGIPAARIDATTLATVKATYTSWGLTWNLGLWTQEERKKILARLLLMCHTELIVRDKIYFKVHSKTSQKTLGQSHITKTGDRGKSTFKYDLNLSAEIKDSAYVAFQEQGKCLDQLLKIMVTAKGAANNISNDIIRADFVQDSQDAQRIGTLAIQRKFLAMAKVSIVTKATCLALECDDVITLSHADYGGTYDVLIDSIKFDKGIGMTIEATRFSQALDDWGDLSPSAVTIIQIPDSDSYQVVISGPDAVDAWGNYIGNVLPGRLRIGETGNHILFDPVEPIQTFVEGGVTRMRIGDLGTDDWGIEFLDHSGNSIVRLDGADVNTIAGWNATVNKFTCQSGEVGMNAEETGGVDWRFWAGHATPGSAPFRVDESGNLYCTLIYATGGTIGGWTIGETKLSITGIELDQAENRIRVFTGANYVDMTAAGLTGYDSVLGTTFTLPTNGDAPEFSSGIIRECVYEIYTSGIIRTDADVASNGGLIINNTDLKGYTSAGLKVLQFIYDGTDQGDAYIGDFDNSNAGIKYDHSVGSLKIKALVEIIGNPALQNMLMNGGFEETDGTNAYCWTSGAGIATETAGGDDSNNYIEITRAGSTNVSYYLNPDGTSHYFEVNEGEVYEVGGSLKSSNGTCMAILSIWAYDKDKGDKSEVYTSTVETSWTTKSITYTVPTGKKFLRVLLRAYSADGWAAFDNIYLKRVDEKAWSFTHADDRTKIDGGTIYTNTIVASAINGAGFGTLTITSGKIAINTTDALEIMAGGNINVLAGGDIILIGDDANPGKLVWTGSTATIEFYSTQDGYTFYMMPSATNACYWYAGNSTYRYKGITMYSDDYSIFGDTSTYINLFDLVNFGPGAGYDKAIDLGDPDHAFDDAYADDWHNVADLFYLDEYDDLQTILTIKPSGEIDPRTGLPLIDDTTLPEWMLTRYAADGDIRERNRQGDKKVVGRYKKGDIMRDPDGKPWLSNKIMFSVLMGAIKELNQKITLD